MYRVSAMYSSDGIKIITKELSVFYIPTLFVIINNIHKII